MSISVRKAIPWALMATLALMAYGWGLNGGYIFDDFVNLVDESNWQMTSLDLPSLHRAMSDGISSSVGRPLALLSFALNYFFTGLNPFPIKATNLAFHVANGLLVYALCRQLFFHTARFLPDDARRSGQFAAWAVAAAWLLHPLQASTVLYAVQRMEIGACTGVLLALLAYLRARAAQLSGTVSWPWWAAVAAATAFGLGFKESVLLVPAYTWALEWTLLRFRASRPRDSTLLRLGYVIGAGAAVLIFVGMVLPAYLTPEAYAFRDFTLQQRLATQPHVLATYLGQILLPLPERLPFYYDAFPISNGWLDPPGTLLGVLILSALAALALAWRRRIPLAALGICWFFAAHALTSNVVPLELAFEHRNYFALLGVLLALAALLPRGMGRIDPKMRRLLALVLVAFLGGMCALQSAAWGDPMRLALSLAARAPDSPRAGYELGLTMLREAGDDWNNPLVSLAAREFETAAKLPGSSPLPEQALAILNGKQKRPVPVEVWHRMQEKLRARPAGPQEEAALFGVLQCRIQRLCAFDDQKLLDTILVAVENNPHSPVILAMYSNFALNVLADLPLAISLARECIQLEPDEVQYHANLLRIQSFSHADTSELERLRAQIAAEDPLGRYRDEVAPASTLEPPADR